VIKITTKRGRRHSLITPTVTRLAGYRATLRFGTGEQKMPLPVVFQFNQKITTELDNPQGVIAPSLFMMPLRECEQVAVRPHFAVRFGPTTGTLRRTQQFVEKSV
jgi:hypothetical protein